jgi:hypothetical protein
MNKLLIALLVSVLSLTASAVELKPDHPDTYTVKKGDTLWDISEHFLSDPWLWPEIWYANPQVNNPHLIFPGDLLTLIYVDGKPRLVKAKVLGGTTKLSPRSRVLSQGDAIPSMPLSVIKPFLTGTRVIDADTVEQLPYVLSNEFNYAISVEEEKIYARGFDKNTAIGDKYSVFRKGRKFIDPDTGENLGIEATHQGKGTVIRKGDPITVHVGDSVRDIRHGDFFAPVDEKFLHPTYFPRKSEKNIYGRIVAVTDGVSIVGQFSVVVINRGEREGIEVGQVFSVMQKGATIKDKIGIERAQDKTSKQGTIIDSVSNFITGKNEKDNTLQMPDESAGEIMVFRTFEKVSLALVMRATRPLHVLDKVQTPE